MEDEDAVLGAGADRELPPSAAAADAFLHRVRALPGQVPGLEHRQAAQPQADHHQPARRDAGPGAGCSARTAEDGSDLEPVPLVPDVIDPDALWACTTCGACVEECPVDIEHVDAIIDMRRYQVMMESSFPSEAGTMLRNIENQGNPWGLRADMRLEWTERPRLRDPGGRRPDPRRHRVALLGRLRRRARRPRPASPPRRSPRVMHAAGVKFAILGPRESCTGDPARRMGNEYLFQEMAKANIETLDGAGVKKIIASCPHCFNTIGNEYPALGGNYEVVHHSQLLGRLVAEGKLAPQDPIAAQADLPRPLLSRPAQRRVRRAAGRARRRPRPRAGRDAPARQARLLLRRRRGADVDGGADRQAHQRRAHRRGARHRRRRSSPPPARTASSCSTTRVKQRCSEGKADGVVGHRHRPGARRLDRATQALTPGRWR